MDEQREGAARIIAALMAANIDHFKSLQKTLEKMPVDTQVPAIESFVHLISRGRPFSPETCDRDKELLDFARLLVGAIRGDLDKDGIERLKRRS